MPQVESLGAQMNAGHPFFTSLGEIGTVDSYACLDQQRAIMNNNLVSNLQLFQRQGIDNMPSASLAASLLAQPSNLFNTLPLSQLASTLGLNQNVSANATNLARLQQQLTLQQEHIALQNQRTNVDFTPEQRVMLLQHLHNQRNELLMNTAASGGAPLSMNQQQLTAQQLAELLSQTAQTTVQSQVAQVLQGAQQQAQNANLQNYIRLAQPFSVVLSSSAQALPQRPQSVLPQPKVEQGHAQQPSSSTHRQTPVSPRILKRARPSSTAPSTTAPPNEGHANPQDVLGADQLREWERIKQQLPLDEQQTLLDVLKSMQKAGSAILPSQQPQSYRPAHQLNQTDMRRQDASLKQENDNELPHDEQPRGMVRHVPGEEIFENLPKKRLRKQQFDEGQDRLASVSGYDEGEK